MAIFVISDLHLSFSCEKPMDIFKGWSNHTQRIEANWRRVVSKNDTVVLPGDLSWALKTEDSLEDFKFIESLPGEKILLKGNHDLWWSTVAKTERFLAQNEIKTVKLLLNNCYEAENKAICGTRGWMYEGKSEEKIVLREAGRLERSLCAAANTGKEPLVFMHYPPAWDKTVCREFFEVLKRYNIDTVYHGHIHGVGIHPRTQEFGGIKLRLISCDNIDFCPYRIE